jgi:hypothetical protein
MVQVRPLPFWLKPWVMALAVAALYVATARLGLMLAMPPDKKATAAAALGDALAAVLPAGYRVWPDRLGRLANIWIISTRPLRFSARASCGVVRHRYRTASQALLEALLHR